MNKKFFQENENQCWDKLLKFNEIGAFAELQRSEEKASIDASGLTKDGRECLIELKNRNQNLLYDNDHGYIVSGCSTNGITYTGTTLYIEPHKAAELFFGTIDGKEPLYVNFLNGSTTIVFNLRKLKHAVTSQQKRIQSKGYQQFEVSERFGLSLKDAAIYENNILTHRPE